MSVKSRKRGSEGRSKRASNIVRSSIIIATLTLGEKTESQSTPKIVTNVYEAA